MIITQEGGYDYMATKIIREEWTNDKELIIEHSVLTGKINITYAGVKFTKVAKKSYSASIEGSTISAEVSGNEFKGLNVMVFGHTINIVKALAWYEWLIGALVLVPCFFYGGIGGALGVLSAYLCIYVMRNIPNVFLKVLVGLVLGAVLVYVVTLIAFSVAALLYG